MPLRIFLPLLLLVACTWLLWPPTTPASHAAEPRIEIHEDVVFGKGGGTALKLDLARPTNPKRPLPAVLLLHGGGWVAGKKSDVLPIAKLLAEEGFVAVTSQYRLARPSINGFGPKNPNPWPAQIEDAKCAVRYLRAEAKRWSIDPERIAAMGFSAGGHLALLLGTMEQADGLEGKGGHAEYSSAVQAVVSFFGPTNMGKAPPEDRTQISSLSPEERAEVVRATALSAIFGQGFLEDPTRASPLRYASEGDAPMLLFQGTTDTLVPPEHTTLMMEALTKAKVPGKVVFHVGHGHGRRWMRDPVATDSLQDVLDFLNQRLRPGKVRSLAKRLRR